MQKHFKIMNMFIFFLPVFMISFTDNFLILWIMMEIQMIMFSSIIWMYYSNKNFMLSFLVIQIISGIFLLILWSFQHLIYFLELSSILLNLVLFLKMGVFPFQNWSINFCSNLYYIDLFVFLTVMKFFPFYFLMQSNHYITHFFLFFNLAGSVLYLSYVNSYKLIIFLSSTVSSMFFLLILFFLGQTMAFFFLLFYLLFLFYLIKEMNTGDWDFIFIGKGNVNIMFAFLFVFSLVGIPFTTGFIMKMIILKSYYNSLLLNFFYFFLYVTSLVFSFFYMKILFFLFLVLQNSWASSLVLKMQHVMEWVSMIFILYAPFVLTLLYFFWYCAPV